MEDTEMSDPAVIVIQPTTDVIKDEIHLEYKEQASSQQPSACDISLQCSAVLQKTEKSAEGLPLQLGINTDFDTKNKDNSEHIATPTQPVSYVTEQNILQLKRVRDEQGLPIQLGITTNAASLDVKSELHCNMKQENTSDITESLDFKPPVQSDLVLKCQLEEVKDEVVPIQHELTPKIAALDVKPELQCNIKKENISDITESLDVKPSGESELELKCQHDRPGYGNTLSVKQLSEHITDKSVDLGVSWNQSVVNQSPGKCEQIETVYRNSDLHLEISVPEDHVHNITRNVSRKNEQFTDNSQLAKHLSTPSAHPTAEKLFCYPQCDTHTPTHTAEKRFTCLYCDKRFRHKHHLSTHIRIHTGEQPFACPYCDKRFRHKTNLSTHIRTHTGEMPFGCPYCDKRFRHTGPLSTHIQNHTGEMPFACLYCDKRFRRKANLSLHIRTHTGENTIPCPYCDKRFSQRSDLSKHLPTHTGEMPFACRYCDKRFSRNCNLSRHIRTHTGDKPFSCPHCEKRFNGKEDLIRHKRTHTGEKPFSCPYCDKRFSVKKDLPRHIRTHTGEKPFSCTYCDKRFSEQGNLSQHMRTHTDKKPLYCSHCEKKFYKKNDLSSHLRAHTVKPSYNAKTGDAI